MVQDQEAEMKPLVEKLMQEAGLSSEQAEKVIKIVVDYVEKDLPLSEKTAIDLELEGVRQEDLNKDRQPFIIP
jgi:hypothetical protein